jgi:hypothetical protein
MQLRRLEEQLTNRATRSCTEIAARRHAFVSYCTHCHQIISQIFQNGTPKSGSSFDFKRLAINNYFFFSQLTYKVFNSMPHTFLYSSCFSFGYSTWCRVLRIISETAIFLNFCLLQFGGPFFPLSWKYLNYPERVDSWYIFFPTRTHLSMMSACSSTELSLLNA